MNPGQKKDMEIRCKASLSERRLNGAGRGGPSCLEVPDVPFFLVVLFCLVSQAALQLVCQEASLASQEVSLASQDLFHHLSQFAT